MGDNFSALVALDPARAIFGITILLVMNHIGFKHAEFPTAVIAMLIPMLNEGGSILRVPMNHIIE